MMFTNSKYMLKPCAWFTLCLLTACGSSNSNKGAPENEKPENSAPSLGVDKDVSLDENVVAVGNFSAVDADGDTLVYSLTGEDAGDFTIAEDGTLSFLAVPDYEAGKTSFTVVVNVSDGELTDSQTLSVTLNDVAEGAWELIWSDEFDGDGLDATKWTHEQNCHGGGNNEQQCYTARPDNSVVENGLLDIIAKEESYSGQAYFDDDPLYDINDTSTTLPYTSARIRTKGKFSFKYGRVEVRAQLPAGEGMWPAFWMLPEDWVYGGWPMSGEIDIMEAANLNTDREFPILGTLQYGSFWPNYVPKGGEYHSDDAFHEEFHVYTIEWEADEMRWFVDGNHYHTQRSEGWYNYIWLGQEQGWGVANPRAPFDQAFHLIINSAVGGGLPGSPDTNWPEDRHLLVDYIRVYQCNSGSDEGVGCASVKDAVDPEVALTEDSGKPDVSEYALYTEGTETLNFTSSGQTIVNALKLAVDQPMVGNVVTDELDVGGDYGQVLEAVFSGPASVRLDSADMSSRAGVNDGFALFGGTGWSNIGQIQFDIFLDNQADDTELYVKLNSGEGNSGEFLLTDVPSGQWTHVAVKIADLLANNSDGGTGVNLGLVMSLFELEARGSGIARVMLDNISISCAVTFENVSWLPDQECRMEAVTDRQKAPSPANVYIDETSLWPAADCCNGATVTEVDSDDPARGKVVEFSYATNETVTYFQSADPIDFSAFAGGTIEFDLLVIDEPASAEWMMKIDCVYPCSTNDVPLSESNEGLDPVVGSWQHFTFNIDDLVSRQGSGLDLTKVDTPLVIFPSWGNQLGAKFRIDNVILKEAP